MSEEAPKKKSPWSGKPGGPLKAMTPYPPPPPSETPPPTPPDVLEPDKIIGPEPPPGNDPRYVPSMPLQVKLLVTNVLSDPTKSLSKQAAAVGMTFSEARNVLKRTDVTAYVEAMLDDAGATVEASCKAIAEALVAVRVLTLGKDKKTGDLNAVHVPDHEYRLRAAELNLKLRGMLAEGKKQDQPQTLAALIAAIQQERVRRGLDAPK